MVKKKALTNREIQLALIENFVNLQKVLTNLTVKFDGLSDNISRLLQLFEISAKSFIRKQEESKGDEKDFLRKLDILLEQNKTVAKGLTLIEEKLRHKVYGDTSKEELEKFGILDHNRDFSNKPRPIPRI
jgi:hypothetical protein